VVSSYFEWLGAGVYHVDARSGSMHGKKFLIKEVYYGSDGSNCFIRMDFHAGFDSDAPGLEARLNVRSGDSGKQSSVVLKFAQAGAEVLTSTMPPDAFEHSWVNILEMRVSLGVLDAANRGALCFQFSLWRDGLPVDAVPQHGWLELKTADPGAWAP